MALHKPPPGIRARQPGAPLVAGDMIKRIGGGALVGLLILGGVLYGDWLWDVIASLIALGSLWELYQLLISKYRLSRGWGLTGGVLMLVTVSMGYSFALVLSILPLVAFLVLFTEVVRRESLGQSYAIWNVGGTLSGLIYIVLPWSFLILIRSQTSGLMLLLTLFLCTWSCDIAAFVAGSLFGQSPLCDRVSPKKSWEGFLAGVAASSLCGASVAYFFDFAPIPLLLLGLLCGIAGQIGDLCESVLKREAKVKDSGKVIPGHGGFLDRFDSILINATLAFFIIEVIGWS
ncbi:MAG: phosphatidate cytidylyltransferase [Synergistaceae bacterium]|jgi:phosphatidate cytidylyltransferase|nr:phosphatidate cytidylyltransferase [Synergistaceae bacterium]